MTKSLGIGRGRPKGAKNKRTVKTEAAVAEIQQKLNKAVPKAFQGDSHTYLMAIYKNPKLAREVRMDAAKACLNYEKPKLQSVLHGSDPANPEKLNVVHTLDPASAKLISDLVK